MIIGNIKAFKEALNKHFGDKAFVQVAEPNKLSEAYSYWIVGLDGSFRLEIYAFDDNQLCFSNLNVLEAHRKNGIAKKCMKVTFDFAKSVGFGDVYLWVHNENHYVKQWYERIGFKFYSIYDNSHSWMICPVNKAVL